MKTIKINKIDEFHNKICIYLENGQEIWTEYSDNDLKAINANKRAVAINEYDNGFEIVWK